MKEKYLLKIGKLYLYEYDLDTEALDSDFISGISLTNDKEYAHSLNDEEEARKLINLFDRVGLNFGLCEIESKGEQLWVTEH